MEIIKRNEELSWLSEAYENSKRKLYPVVITGARRVGKTTLVSEFIKDKSAFYFFVNESKTSALLLDECNAQIRAKEDKFISIKTYDELFEYLIERSSFDIIVFDEFQNFFSAEKSVFGILQHIIDKNEHTSKKLLIFLGSITGLMQDIFYGSSSPLFGRIKSTLNLKPLSFWQIYASLGKIGFGNEEERVKFYFIFGGYPKYLSFVDDYHTQAKNVSLLLDKLLLRSNSIMEDEIKGILSSEFGSKGSQYYSILEAIATGHTKMSEVASYAHLPATSLTQFISNLISYYDFIERKTSIFAKKMKDSRYSIKNPLFRFWFKFVFSNSTYLEVGNYALLKEKINFDIGSFYGREFEALCKEFLIRLSGQLRLKEVGNWWHRDQEIDLISIGYETILWECKWSKIDEKEASRISSKLDEKSKSTGIISFKKGLFAKEVSANAKKYFDYVINLGDIIEEKFPHGE